MEIRAFLEQLKELIGEREEYMGVAAFLLKHGKEYTATPASFKGRRMKAKACYRNALLKVVKDPSLTYVEGYITCFDIPIVHAWCIDKEGNVIDPTLDGKHIGMDYFGVPFKGKYVASLMMERGLCASVIEMNRELMTKGTDYTDIIALQEVAS